jgi:hypothetical protein
MSDLEQSLATGLTSNGENTSSVKLVGEVFGVVKDDKVEREQKVRLAILCLCCVKLSKNDYETLLGLFGEDDQKILKNFIALGVSYDSSVGKSTKTVTKDQQKIASKRMETTSMNLNRYTSIV